MIRLAPSPSLFLELIDTNIHYYTLTGLTYDTNLFTDITNVCCQIGLSPNSYTRTVNLGLQHIFNISNLQYDVTYYLCIKSQSQGGTSDASNELIFPPLNTTNYVKISEVWPGTTNTYNVILTNFSKPNPEFRRIKLMTNSNTKVQQFASSINGPWIDDNITVGTNLGSAGIPSLSIITYNNYSRNMIRER